MALQEVDNRTFRERAPKQNDIDFATELGYHTGMIPAYGKTIPYRGGYYGIAILSKYRIHPSNYIFGISSALVNFLGKSSSNLLTG